MDKLFGSNGDEEWKSSGNILHYERYQKKKKYPIKDIRQPLLSHVYVQPILINQNRKNKNEMSLSQFIVGKKMEIQERKPDLDYNSNNISNLKKNSNTYYTSEFNIPDNSSIKVKSLQKLNKLDKNNHSTLSTHNLSDQIITVNTNDKNKQNIQYNESSVFPTTIKRNVSTNNENSVINSNIRRLSNLNNTIYKTPTMNKINNATKKLVYQNVMKISSFTDYKDDIEEIEKAIQLSSNMNINNLDPGPIDNNKYEPKNKSPLKNEISNATIIKVPDIEKIDNNDALEYKNNLQTENNTEITNHIITENETNNNENLQIEDISNIPNDVVDTSTVIEENTLLYDNDVNKNSIENIDNKNKEMQINMNDSNKNIASMNDEKSKQEQRDILLENELENEKKLDYHLFMSSTQRLGSEQKIDEIIVNNENNKEHLNELNINDTNEHS
ncbi:hypothetical protein BCR36DRAFT_280779 [Piromyces finnis]|uniref:Uncharacterized protein n=1 Tax=Piromyces finnis TaxID=1754191 RepID=A0A1Y1VHD2_9FUNG|nr:hypothetical protein BCR36DRAFT_280779 [Piromyces finnis]|eukprot:ORX56128.1 hypothetical protein BCR36DRAFT_280779 [Piromyces finnis]